jgi:hypothetical protein
MLNGRLVLINSAYLFIQGQILYNISIMSKAIICLAIICMLAFSCSPAPKPPTVTLPPKENQAPIAKAVTGTRELKPSSTISVQVAAADPDGDKLTYKWSAVRGTIEGEGRQVKWTAPAEMGEFEVICVVSDGKGGEASASGKFKVTDNPFGNEEPDKTIYIQLSVPSGQAVEINRKSRIFTTAEIECEIMNESTGKYTFAWSAPVGKLVATGLAEGNATRVGWIAPGVAGSYSVSVTVTDLAGNKAKGIVNFEVVCCSEPE